MYERIMDIKPEKHFYGNRTPNGSNKGLMIVVIVLLILGGLFLWNTVYNDLIL